MNMTYDPRDDDQPLSNPTHTSVLGPEVMIASMVAQDSELLPTKTDIIIRLNHKDESKRVIVMEQLTDDDLKTIVGHLELRLFGRI